MALFHFKWLRRFVRRNTNPIREDKAELWKRRLSLGYALVAWQAFGLVVYMMYTGRNDWAKYYGYKDEEEMKLSPAQQYAKMFKMDNAKVIRYSGLSKVNETIIENETKEEP